MEIHLMRTAIPARAMGMAPALPQGAREMETEIPQVMETQGSRADMEGINNGKIIILKAYRVCQ